MKRSSFIKLTGTTLGGLGIMKASALSMIANEKTEKYPVLFCAHGSPMNAIEVNSFTTTLKSIGKTLPAPKAILCVSAHWMTKGTYVQSSPKPRMIYDFGGFPRELSEVQYNASGS